MWSWDRNTMRETAFCRREKQPRSKQKTTKKRWGREIKWGASGCQEDQNKHRAPCRRKARFSLTDTKLDLPLLKSQLQNTVTSALNSTASTAVSPPSSFHLTFFPFYPVSAPPLHPALQAPPFHRLCCPLHPFSLIHNWTALTAAEAKQRFN